MNNNIDIDKLFRLIELKEPNNDLASKIMLGVKKAERRQRVLSTLYQFISISVYIGITLYSLLYYDILSPIINSLSVISGYWGLFLPILFLIGLNFIFERYFSNIIKHKS